MKKNYIKQHRHDAEFEARIGKVIKEFSNEQETISIEELESWVEKDNMKRRAKRKRVMSVAACFLLICGFSLSMRYYVNMDDPIAVAGKDDDKVATEVDGQTVIKNNDHLVEENVGKNEEVHTTWEAVLAATKEYPDMLIPGYVPEGYEFKALRVASIGAGHTYELVYANAGSKELIVRQREGVETSVIADYDGKIEAQNMTVYVKHEGRLTTGAGIWGKILVNITSAESEREIVNIMEALKSGS